MSYLTHCFWISTGAVFLKASNICMTVKWPDIQRLYNTSVYRLPWQHNFSDFDRHAFAKLLLKDTNIKRKEKASRPSLGQKKKKKTDVIHMKNVICLLLYWLTRKLLVAVFISEKNVNNVCTWSIFLFFIIIILKVSLDMGCFLSCALWKSLLQCIITARHKCGRRMKSFYISTGLWK